MFCFILFILVLFIYVSFDYVFLCLIYVYDFHVCYCFLMYILSMLKMMSKNNFRLDFYLISFDIMFYLFILFSHMFFGNLNLILKSSK